MLTARPVMLKASQFSQNIVLTEVRLVLTAWLMLMASQFSQNVVLTEV